MTSHMVSLGAWHDLPDAAASVLMRTDPLTGDGYRARWEVGVDTAAGLVHLRCLSPIPAGVWIRHRCGLLHPQVLPGPADTGSFLTSHLESDVHTIRPRPRGDR